MKAFREGVLIDCEFLDAPFAALGPPDELIAYFYPNRKYFQWYLEEGNQTPHIQISLSSIKAFIRKHGPFDGILGFSQGAEMCTRLVQELEATNSLGNIRMVILISGVPPGFKVLRTDFVEPCNCRGRKACPYRRETLFKLISRVCICKNTISSCHHPH